MLRSENLLRVLAAVLVGGATVASIVACNTVLGIQDVQLRGGRDGGRKDGSSPDPDPDPDPDPEEDAATNPRAAMLQVALGSQHTCARRPEGTVRCWGDDQQGQTGGGTLATAGYVTSPQDVKGISDAVDIAAGYQHTCVAHKSGKVSCWGFNSDGQLGNGETGNRKPAPVEVSGLTNASAVAAGGNFSCAVRGASGAVVCWGANGSGQLGKGGGSDSSTPVAVSTLSDVVSLSAGERHACAATNAGTVYCWGDGAMNQLGREGGSATPVLVENVTEAVQVAAGKDWTCAVTKSGTVMCWGANELGELGSTAPSPSPPVTVAKLSDAIWVGAGRKHACAARNTGSVVCWGAGGRGQLGDGKTRLPAESQAAFVTTIGVVGAISTGAGNDHACAGSSSNRIFCWGANDRGQLGVGSETDSATPALVPGYP